MADNETVVGILIQARADTARAIGEAASDVEKLNKFIRDLKNSSDGSEKSLEAIGRAMIAGRVASRQLSDALNEAAREGTPFVGVLRGIQDAARGIPGPMGGAARSFASTATAASGAGVAVLGFAAVAALAVGALTLGAKSIADYNLATRNLSLETGLSTREIGGLRVVAAETNVTMGEMSMGMRHLNRNIASASEGMSAARTKFVDAKIAYLDANGAVRASGDVFVDVAKKVAATEDPVKRVQIAMEFFGARTGAVMIPALLEAAKGFETFKDRAEAAGITLTKLQQEQAEQATKSFAKMAISLEGLKNAFGNLAAQTLNPFLDQLAQLLSELNEYANNPAIANAKGQQFLVYGPAGPYAGAGAPGLPRPTPLPGGGARGVGGFSEAPGAWDVGTMLPGIETAGELEEKRLDAIRAQIDVMKQQLALNPELLAELEKALRTAKEHARTIAEQNLLYQAQRDLIRLAPGQVGVSTAGLEAFGPPVPKTAYQQAMEEAYKATPKGFKTGPSLEDVFPQELSDEWINAMERYGVTLEQVNEAALGSAKSLEGVAAGMIKQKQLTLELREIMAVDITNGIRSFVDSALDGFRNIGQAFSNMVRSMIADIAAAVASKTILTALGLPGGQGGGTIGGAQAGGSVPFVMAQSGLIVSGIRGVDTVPILAGRGETILSHDLTDKLGRFLNWAESNSRQQSIPRSESVTNNFNVPVTVHSMIADDRSLRTFGEEKLVPMLNDVIPRGSYRRR